MSSNYVLMQEFHNESDPVCPHRRNLLFKFVIGDDACPSDMKYIYDEKIFKLKSVEVGSKPNWGHQEVTYRFIAREFDGEKMLTFYSSNNSVFILVDKYGRIHYNCLVR